MRSVSLYLILMIVHLGAIDYPYSSDYQTQENETQDRNGYFLNEPERESEYNPNRLPQENYYRQEAHPERYRSYSPNASPEGTFENSYNTKIGGYSPKKPPKPEEYPNPYENPPQNTREI
jgi:hypothetical protein